MAFSNGDGGQGRALSEINVTPLVDVMLVLLIIFMVAAPMLTTGVSVDLPKADAPRMDIDQEHPLARLRQTPCQADRRRRLAHPALGKCHRDLSQLPLLTPCDGPALA